MIASIRVILRLIQTLRYMICPILNMVFGYYLPAINSTRAVLLKDLEGVTEYLTYWSVLTCLTFIEQILSLFYFFENYPPECKVIFILWLTLPQFQGAFRLYQYIVRPYFEVYEEDIDTHIEVVSGKVKESTLKYLRRVLWQVFLASNDSLLNQSTADAITSVATVAIQRFRSLRFETEPESIEPISNQDVKVDHLEGSVESIEPIEPIEQQFETMLMEGITVEAGDSLDELQPCYMKLTSNKKEIIFEILNLDDRLSMASSPVTTTELTRSYVIGISSISSEMVHKEEINQIFEDDEYQEDENVPIILINYFKFDSKMIEDPFDLSNQILYVYLRTTVEYETVLMGLQSLLLTTRKNSQDIMKSFSIIQRIIRNKKNKRLDSINVNTLLYALETWQQFCNTEGEDDPQENSYDDVTI